MKRGVFFPAVSTPCTSVKSSVYMDSSASISAAGASAAGGLRTHRLHVPLPPDHFPTAPRSRTASITTTTTTEAPHATLSTAVSNAIFCS